MQDSTDAFPTLKSPLFEPTERTPDFAKVEMGRQHRLMGCMRRVEELGPSDRNQMYSLFNDYFDGVTRSKFERDLAEKEWVCVGTDSSSGEIRGFSTLMRLDAEVDGDPVVALISGDTIISREHWGQTVFPLLMGQHMLSVAEEASGVRTFWLLISSGYKTYRFLPTFFRNFFPRYDASTPPDVQRLICTLARMKYGNRYKPDQGIVRFAEPTPLRPGIADVDSRRLTNPHIKFFVQANPGYRFGDDLVCITEISSSNLTPAGKRVLRGSALRQTPSDSFVPYSESS